MATAVLNVVPCSAAIVRLIHGIHVADLWHIAYFTRVFSRNFSKGGGEED